MGGIRPTQKKKKKKKAPPIRQHHPTFQFFGLKFKIKIKIARGIISKLK